NLSARVLEEVRLLTNLETTTQKLLQVILIGQPALAELLSRRNLRQLSQRVTARYHLRPFSEEESQHYVRHRMEIAGQRQPIFTKQAMRAAHRRSHGIPRLLNTICDRALLNAYATGQTRVKAAVVRRAAKEVLGMRRNRRWIGTTAAAALLAVVGSTLALVATGGRRSLGTWALARVDRRSAPPIEAPALNKGDGNYYTASSTSPLRPLDVVPSPPTPPLTAQGAAILGVIDAKDKTVLQLVPTFNVPQVPSPGHPAGTAHSVAVDATNNRIFVPLGANNVFPDCTTGCIAVYWHGDEDKPGEAATP